MNPGPKPTPIRGGPRPAEILFGVIMASTSGAAIIAHTFLDISMRFTAGAIVLPSAVILTGFLLLAQNREARFHEFARLLWIGAAWGLAATLAYDLIRPALMALFGLDFDPYKAMGIFGQLATGRPEGDPVGLVVGWIYHFWNGISFGMMYALVLPRGGLTSGLIWALILQGLMMAVYPSFLEARLADPGFLISGIVGHGIWGLILGGGVRRTYERSMRS